MDLKIHTSDPLNVLSSTKSVVLDSNDVSINPRKIEESAKLIKRKIEIGLETSKEAFATTGDFQEDIQLVFLQDVVNFCFWSKKNEPKWQVEWPAGEIVSGGWYCLRASFLRSLVENKKILDAQFLSEIDLSETKSMFKSATPTEIPLIIERTENLREAGRVLMEEFGGQFLNVVEEAKFDAIRLTKLLLKYFPSFRDISLINDREVFFLKRAQICPSDISLLVNEKSSKHLENVDQFTAFADYRLPQLLRELGIIDYSQKLAQKIDKYEVIPHDSNEEIEIRAATIWAVELMRQDLKKYRATEIDYALWLLTQDQDLKMRPHHRTYTIYY